MATSHPGDVVLEEEVTYNSGNFSIPANHRQLDPGIVVLLKRSYLACRVPLTLCLETRYPQE